MLTPQSPAELAEALGCASAGGGAIQLGGRFTKNRMAGPVAAAETVISTAALSRVLKYEPGDLTISVEAGMRYEELTRLLAQNGQALPLDPPWAAEGTIGGVVASNLSGPRRRFYGTARDFVIGMQFATLEGKLVQTGGMVVKNVAGLDMAKIMIGSFGTLAAIAVINFKLVPTPPRTRTFLLAYPTLREAAATRDRLASSVLQPLALDLLNPAAARMLGEEGFVVAVGTGGNPAVIDRYGRELSGAKILDGDAEREFWEHVREFTPRFLNEQVAGTVIRVSCTLSAIPEVVGSTDAPCIARAGSGVVYAYFDCAEPAEEWLRRFPERRTVVEFAAEEDKAHLDLWPSPGGDLELMRRVKNLFDPRNLLNRGRLYGRI